MQQETLPPADSSIHAAVRLLSDEDPNVARACGRQLLHWGAVCREPLETAACADDPRLRVRARALLRSLDLARWVETTCSMAGHAGGDRTSFLLDGLTSISALVRPLAHDLCVKARLRELACDLRPVILGRSSLTAARNLANYLAVQQGYTGRRARCPHGDDVLFDCVVDLRRGQPATLAAFYLLVGREAGLKLTAVRLRDYFLVRLHGRRNVLLDPFHDGRSVTKADCLRYLRECGAEATSSQLADVDDADLLIGVLDDLLHIHDRRDEDELCSAIRRVRESLASP